MNLNKKPYRIEGREPTIFRVKKDPNNPYVMVDRRPIDNSNLSYKAKGILTYLLSRPDGWDINIADLENHGIDGRDSIRAGLKELRKVGHLRYKQNRKSGRFSNGIIEVHEFPFLPQTDNPYSEEPLSEIPQVENPLQVLSNLNNKEVNERYSIVSHQLVGLTGGLLNGSSADLIATWLEKHNLNWIQRAIDLAKSKGARSAQYVDKILITWEANGYPKSRLEKVNEVKKQNNKRYSSSRLREIANGN